MSEAVFLETKRLALRSLEKEYAEFIRSNINREDFRRNLFMKDLHNLDQTIEYYKEDFALEEGNYALIVELDGEEVGFIAVRKEDRFSGEIAVWIDSDYQRNGYAQEVCKKVTSYSFDQLGYHRVYARIMETNKASKHVFEKLGYRCEGKEEEAFHTDGEYQDVLRYRILEHEWSED